MVEAFRSTCNCVENEPRWRHSSLVEPGTFHVSHTWAGGFLLSQFPSAKVGVRLNQLEGLGKLRIFAR